MLNYVIYHVIVEWISSGGSSTELMVSSSSSSSGRCMASSFSGVFSVFPVFGCNLLTESSKVLPVGA